MPTFPASYDTTHDYIPIVPRSKIYKMGGVPLLCANNTTLNQWKAKELDNIAIGAPLWPAGQLIRVLTDADGVWRKWDGFSSFTTVNNSGGSETVTSIAALLDEATPKTTPVDADKFVYLDSEADFSLVSFTWQQVKTALSSIFGLLTGFTMAGNINMGGNKITNYTATITTVSGDQTVDQTYCGIYVVPDDGALWTLPGIGFTKPVSFAIHHLGIGNITFATNNDGTIKFGSNATHTQMKSGGAVTVTLLILTEGAYVWNIIGQTEELV